VVAAHRCPVILMHMRGGPATMMARANYRDVAKEVAAELATLVQAAREAGIADKAIAVDPGFGFAKHPPHSLALLRRLSSLATLGFPIVAGVSRKGFIGAVSGEAEPALRFPGSIAAGLFALARGASVLRVHDVKQTAQAVRVWHALTREDTTA
jgi:dihydropteroate synthase